jgi:excisionase family DNA binding protein
MAKGKNVLTTGDVAKICNVAPRTVSKWFDSGQLKGYRIPGSKDRRIPLSELFRFMKANNMPMEALPLGKIRILVVDGSEPPAPALLDALTTRGGYDVQVARSSFEVGAAIQKLVPHVVLINLLTNGVDAHSICKSIRSNEDFAAVKIIALANQLSSQESAALLQKGFDNHVSNPADPGEVIRKIEEATAIIY